MIKLLPKSLIVEQKAKEQLRTIEEGMKLAKRVDGLRETYSKTEQDLEKYRIATLEAIGKEIGKLEEKKNALTAEFRAMKSKYDSLMLEISTKRVELSQFEKSLRGWEKKLEKREEESGLMEIDVMEAKQKAEVSVAIQKENERITANLLVQADEKRNRAEATRLQANHLREKTETERKDTEASLRLREYGIKSKEKELLIMQTNLTAEKKEVEREWIKIKDQRATLQRSIERLRAGRLP